VELWRRLHKPGSVVVPVVSPKASVWRFLFIGLPPFSRGKSGKLSRFPDGKSQNLFASGKFRKIMEHFFVFDFLGRRSDGLILAARFVAWSNRRVWMFQRSTWKCISLPLDIRDMSALGVSPYLEIALHKSKFTCLHMLSRPARQCGVYRNWGSCIWEKAVNPASRGRFWSAKIGASYSCDHVTMLRIPCVS